MTKPHTPVLLNETLSYLKCGAGKVFVDCTLGDGGHAEEILKRIGSGGTLIGLDHDKEALEFAKKRLSKHSKQIIFINKNFRRIKTVLHEKSITSVDGVLFDLGLSSRHLQTGERGFSFLIDGPLDMRMDRSLKTDAYKLINTLSTEELIRIIREYGEERWAAKIAKRIADVREKEEITKTAQLAGIVSSSIPKSRHPKHIHPATKTFQALRIAVNDELHSLEEAIRDAVDLLSAGGRICVISFHSLEDRIVKTSFRRDAKECVCPPSFPQCVCNKKKTISIITAKPVVPGAQEIEANHRARSAKLRVAEKLYIGGKKN